MTKKYTTTNIYFSFVKLFNVSNYFITNAQKIKQKTIGENFLSLIYEAICEAYEIWENENAEEKIKLLNSLLKGKIKLISLHSDLLKSCKLVSIKQSAKITEIIGEIEDQLIKLLNKYNEKL